MHAHYELIFSWLRFAMVPLFSKRQRALQRFILFVSILNFIINALMTMSLALYLIKLQRASAMAAFIIKLFLLIHHCVLCFSNRKLLRVAIYVSKIKTESELQLKCWTYVCMITSILYCIAVIISTSLLVIKYGNPDIQYLLFGFSWENNTFNQIFFVLSNSSDAYFLLMPVNAFLIFYISVCRDLGSMFETFRKSMNSLSQPYYNLLLKEFHTMTNLVTYVDNNLNVLVFWATLVNMSSVHYALALVVGNYEISRIVTVLYNLTYNIVMFYMTCHYASVLSNIVSNLSSEAHLLPENLNMSPLKYLRFLLVVSKDVHLTVWKFFPLRRNYVLTSIGTIITYSVLVDNLLKNN